MMAVLQMGLHGFFTHLLDCLFPPFCLVCGSRTPDENNLLVCNTCLRGITLIGRPSCIRCGKPFFTAEGGDHVCGKCLHTRSNINAIKALGTYDGALRSVIHLIKYKKKFAAVAVLGRLLDEHALWHDYVAAHDVIVPVPLHKRRLRARGFNQAVLWANVIGKKFCLPVERNAVHRTRWTAPQVRLHGTERMNNVRNAFSVRKPLPLKNAAVLLVDDVYTTGATMNECARVMRKAGASRINGLVIARAL